MLVDVLFSWLRERGVTSFLAQPLAAAASVLALLLSAWLAHLIAKRVVLRVVSAVIERSEFAWDDVLLRTHVFTRASHVAPALVVTVLGDQFFTHDAAWARTLRTVVNVYLVIILLLVIDALLDAAIEIYNRNATLRRVPVKGFVQGAKLVAFLLGGVLILSLVLGRSPLYLLSGLGALTAVLLLIFKDALLGLVAGVQISVNRMVEIGDWIEMSKYGADGDVVDVSLTTVKVQNWDKTISTIPTYALISEPVKNWRGMTEAGGRRIKRAILLDMNSFRFVDDELLRKLSTFRRLRPHLEQKLPELKAWNEREGVDQNMPVNARRLTNVGCYRAYALAYLRSHPAIHPDLTLLVRQLAPSDKGLPLEIYAFTADTAWATYEGVQADIFDHLITILPEFGLRVFQSPAGHDLRELAARAAADSPAASHVMPAQPR